MTITRKKFFKGCAFFSLLIVILWLTITVILNFGTINSNYSSQQNHHTIHLSYPHTVSPTTFTAFNVGDNKIENLPLATVDVCLLYQGALAEGTKVDVSAVGFVYPDGLNVMNPASLTDKTGMVTKWDHSITIGFEGATPYDLSIAQFQTPQGEFPVLLNEADSLQMRECSNNALPVYQTIKWDLQGDYSPFVIVGYSNKTVISHTYTNSKIHVSGKDIIQQENYARINTWLAIVLFVFTLIMSGELLYKLRPDFISQLFGIECDTDTNKETTNGTPPSSDINQQVPKQSDISPPKNKQKKR